MTIKVKVLSVLSTEDGVSKSSGKEWRKVVYEAETCEQYPKKICFGVFNDKIEELGILIGCTYTLGVDVESRVWERPSDGKKMVFTDITAKVVLEDEQEQAPEQVQVEQAAVAEAVAQETDGLPF